MVNTLFNNVVGENEKMSYFFTLKLNEPFGQPNGITQVFLVVILYHRLGSHDHLCSRKTEENQEFMTAAGGWGRGNL